jgi:uncharacterized membrane protein YoaK (UPF0700 family)
MSDALRSPWSDRREVAAVLVALTAVAGALDAVAFLQLGGAFVSNQTGTVLLLAMNASGRHTVDTAAALVSFGSFVVGAIVAARVLPPMARGEWWPSRSSTALAVSWSLVAAATALQRLTDVDEALVVAPVAAAMGMHAALAKRVAVTFLTTGYITGSTTTAAMESPLGDRSSRWWWYGAVPVGAMAAGAAIAARLSDETVTGAFVLCLVALAGCVGVARVR